MSVPFNSIDRDRILRLIDALDRGQGMPVSYPVFQGEGKPMASVTKPATAELRIFVSDEFVSIEVTGRAPVELIRAALADPSGAVGSSTIPGIAEE